MKIGFFVSDITKVGGIERVTATLLTEFSKSTAFEFEIISLFRGRNAPNYQIPDEIKIHYISEKSHGDKPHSAKRIVSLICIIGQIRKFFKGSDYDLVIAQSFPPAFALYCSGFYCKRIIAAEHVYAKYYSTALQLIRKYVYRKIAKVVVLTNADKAFFDSQIDENKTVVIPNPVCLRNRPDSLPDSKRIISVGRLEYQKGYDNLIDGFVEVHQRHPGWELDIYGGGTLLHSLKAQIDNLGLTDVIHLKGVTNDIDAALRTASFFVMPSRFEGFPMVLVEAMCQGLPCVSYDCPNGPSDIIKDGYNGLLIENQNQSALVKGIEYMIDHPEERKRMGANAPDSIAPYAPGKIAEKWVRLFNNLK